MAKTGEEILSSIEERLQTLIDEIAALEAAQSELVGRSPQRKRARTRPVRGKIRARDRQPADEEDWIARRAAELEAQSRGSA